MGKFPGVVERAPYPLPRGEGRRESQRHARDPRPAPTGNTIAVKHAVYSPRLREPRAREIAEVVLSAPWATDLDAISALELGRILALIERLDEAIGDNLATARTRKLVDQRLAASRRLTELLDRHGMTPEARAEFAAKLGRRSVWEQLRKEMGIE